MRPDLAAPSSSTRRQRAVAVIAYPISATPRQVLNDTASGGVNLSAYAQTISQTDTSATIRLMLPSTVTVPVPQCSVTIQDAGLVVFSGLVESVQTRETRGGEKSTTLVLRRRDATPYWRDVPRVSRSFSIATDLGAVARQIASDAGLAADEYSIPGLGVQIGQDQVQLAQLSLWDMLRTTLAPARSEPFVDARGLLKPISRDIRRPADYVLEDFSSVREIGATTTVPALTSMRVRYIAPFLARVNQVERLLGSATLTCGFFHGDSQMDLWWSDDHTQRADVNPISGFRTLQSINENTLGPIGSEAMTVTSIYGATVSVHADYVWLSIEDALPVAALAAAIASPDLFGLGSFAKAVAVAGLFSAAMTFLMRMGTGVYEVWGVPYDYVQQVNEVEAYDIAAPEWHQKIEEFESNLIPNEDVASAVATSELLYRARSASKATMVMVDDYRIEPGDIFELPDARRFYVLTYSRELTRGAEALIQLEGFFT